MLVVVWGGHFGCCAGKFGRQEDVSYFPCPFFTVIKAMGLVIGRPWWRASVLFPVFCWFFLSVDPHRTSNFYSRCFGYLRVVRGFYYCLVSFCLLVPTFEFGRQSQRCVICQRHHALAVVVGAPCRFCYSRSAVRYRLVLAHSVFWNAIWYNFTIDAVDYWRVVFLGRRVISSV